MKVGVFLFAMFAALYKLWTVYEHDGHSHGVLVLMYVVLGLIVVVGVWDMATDHGDKR